MKKQILYFIACGEYAVKIGFTEDIQQRMKSFQTGNPYDLKLLYMIDNINPQLETFIHTFLDGHQIRNEWYEYKTAERIISHLKGGATMLNIILFYNPLLHEAFVYKQVHRKLPWWYHKIDEIDEGGFRDHKKETPQEYINRILDQWKKEHVSVFDPV